MVASWSRRVGGRTLIEYNPDDLVWALYARESDADDLEQVMAQLTDLRPLALGVGGRIGVEYPENNTSAFRRQRVRLPDGTFGFRVIRPDWDAMMTELRRGTFNALAVVNIDRSMRDPRDLEDLIDLVEHYGVLVKGLTGSFDLTTDDGIAQARNAVNQRNAESRNTSRRVAAGKRRAAFKGKNSGGGRRAFGWRKDRKRAHKRESALIAATVPRLLAGVSPRTIAQEWDEQGIPSVTGSRWTASTVSNIFSNPRLCGWRTFHGEVLKDFGGVPVRGDWEPLVSETDHLTLVGLLYARPTAAAGDRKPSERGKVTKTLLSGIVRCGKCHARMIGNHRSYPDGTRVGVYKCRSVGDGGCGGVSRLAKLVDDHIRDLVIAEQKQHQFRRVEDLPPWDGQQRLGTVTAKIAELTAEYRNNPKFSGARYFALMEELEAEEAALKGQKRRYEARRDAQTSAAVDLESEWGRPGFTLEQKQAAVRKSIQAVVIHPAGPGRRTFDPDLIEVIWREQRGI